MDLTKALKTLNSEGLWKIMENGGCSAKFIEILRQFRDGMKAHILDNGDTSAFFLVNLGVKQACDLAQTFFSLVFSATLADANKTNEENICFNIKYRTDVCVCVEEGGGL